MEIDYNEKFEVLFTPGALTRYTIISSGRAGGKSHAVSAALVNDTYNDDYNTLFTRYTMTSAHDSIIPEFKDKIELFGCEDDFEITAKDVVNKISGGAIMFRGLMVNRKSQIAKLKSIAKLKRFIIDEGQEMDDESMFDQVDQSIRSKEVKNEIIIIWNPPRDKNNWIYRRFFKEPGVDITFNGVKGDVTYIYVTYLENKENLSESFLEIAEKAKQRNYDKYLNEYLGLVIGLKEGQIYHWNAMPEGEWEPTRQTLCYGVDWGYTNDQTAVVRVDFDADTKTVYLKQVLYQKECQPRDVAKAIKADMEERGCGKSVLVYCDPARPEHIAELRRHNVNACKAVNKNKAGRINYLQGFTVFYDGADIGNEADNYSFKPHPMDKTQFTNEPEDGNDHCFTATTQILTKKGYKSIAKLCKGDIVRTSQGWKRVLKKWDNGVQDVLCMCLIFSNFKVYIEATPNHLFKTDKGWKQLQSLQKGDKLFLHYALMEEYTESMKGQNTTPAIDGSCIEMSGNTTTEQSPKATKSTTRILTQIITRLKTLFAYQPKNTRICTSNMIGRMAEMKKGKQILIGSDRLHQNGMVVKKEGNGIVNTQEIKNAKNMILSALSAVLRISPRTQLQNTAQPSVLQKQGEIADLIMKQESALSAVSHLKRTNTESNDSALCLVVQDIEEVSRKQERVFDLTVEDCHEYYANGILVHNCMDAANYGAVTHLRRLGVMNDDDML